jgi:hypothetical protein
MEQRTRLFLAFTPQVPTLGTSISSALCEMWVAGEPSTYNAAALAPL